MFMRRVVRYAALSAAMVGVSLGIGIVGYHATESLPWIDSLLNASMILGGMGQVNELHTNAGKLFASGYALFAGIVFLAAAGILMAPVVHRMSHALHLEERRRAER